MPGLILWKTQEIDRFKRDMDRLFSRFWDDFCIPILPRPSKEGPFVDLSETEDRLILRAEIPGVKPEDLEISLSRDMLTLRGEVREETNEAGCAFTERGITVFSRTIRLPCRVQVDEVKATYREGLLSVVMPKCKPQPPREIRVNVS